MAGKEKLPGLGDTSGKEAAGFDGQRKQTSGRVITPGQSESLVNWGMWGFRLLWGDGGEECVTSYRSDLEQDGVDQQAEKSPSLGVPKFGVSISDVLGGMSSVCWFLDGGKVEFAGLSPQVHDLS